MRQTVQPVLDRFAIGTSVLCALHCIGLPLLLSVFPSLFALPFEDHVLHQILVWLVVPSSIIAALLGCRRHKDQWVLIGVGVGLLGMVLTAMYGHDYLGEAGEKVGTVLAGCVLAFSHWRNFSLCRKGSCHHNANGSKCV